MNPYFKTDFIKVRDPYHRLLFNIIYTSNWLTNFQNKQLKKFEITPEQYNIIHTLHLHPLNPVTIKFLSARMLTKMSNTSRLVEKLRIKGLIVWETCKNDRRACRILITKRGLALLSEIDKMESKWTKLFDRLSEDEAQKLNSLLDKLRK